VVDGKVVPYDPFDLAGDALGHAGETSEVSRRGRAAYGSNCRDHRSERAGG
jgi:surface antigen